MPEQLLEVLKLALLALLYLFFVRVTRVVWVEVAGPRLHWPFRRGPAGEAAMLGIAEPPRRGATRPADVGPLTAAMVVVAPVALAGRRYQVNDELTLGRASGCHIAIEDTYVSSVHARVFRRDGAVFVEDLGSTNGTFLNGVRVSGPLLVPSGGQVQVGSTVLELVT